MTPQQTCSSHSGSRRNVLIFLVFGCLFLLFNYADHGFLKTLAATRTLFESRGGLKACFYLGTNLMAIAAAEAAFFSASRLVRWWSVALGVVTLAAQMICRGIGGGDLGLNEVQTWWREIDFASNAFVTFKNTIVFGMLKAILLMTAVGVLAGRLHLGIRKRWLVLCPLAWMVVGLATWWTGGLKYLAYPSFVRVPVVVFGGLLVRDYDGPRDPVSWPADPKTPFQKPKFILLLVDESVRGDQLSLNGCPADTTPFLKSVPGIVNLGVACATANYSAPANLMLRTGIQSHELPDKQQRSLHMASIFQYAKAAGYRTFYLDAQGAKGVLSNHMNRHELEAVDDFWQASAHPSGAAASSDNDRLILAKIKAVIRSGQPAFVYANKCGCHFPYAWGYPPERAIFKPVMSKVDSLLDVDRQTVLNTYHNNIRWSVDDFFKELLPGMDPKEVFLLYTSDHGQSIKEGKYLSTYGDVEDPPVVQANVPIFLMGDGAMVHFPEGTARFRDKTSAFQIFPSLLIAMSYPEKLVIGKYGIPLWSPDPPERRFYVGDLFGRGRGRLISFDGSGARH